MARSAGFELKVKLDDGKLWAKIKLVQARARNVRPWFDNLATALAAAQRTNFATHGSLAGGWKPLSPEYGTWKHTHRPGAPLMINTGKLAESLTSKHRLVHRMGLTNMVIGSDVSYAAFHQYGTRKMPARKILVIPESVMALMKKDLAAYVANGRMRYV